MTITTPLLWVICHPVARIDIAYLYTKFDDFRFSRSSDMIGAPKRSHMTWPRPYQKRFVVRRLWLAHSTCTSNLKSLRLVHQLRRCIRQRKTQKKWGGLRWLRVIQGHRQHNHLAWPIRPIEKRRWRNIARRVEFGHMGIKVHNILPWTPTNRRAKFDAASFILGGEIRNHTNKNTQTINDISTLCLSACVGNKPHALSYSCVNISYTTYYIS